MAEIEFKGYRFDTGLIMVFISGFVLLIWILLKLFRVIQTPLIFELMPIIVGLLAVYGFGVTVGRILQELKHLKNDLDELKSETKGGLGKLNEDFIMLRADFKHFVKYNKSLTS